MISFHVKSLSTNLLLHQTIEIILSKVYQSKNIENSIPKNILRELLYLCTKEAHRTGKKKKEDKLKNTQQQKSLHTQKKDNNNNNKIKNKQTNERNKKKIIQLLTEVPELVTLDCSFTHVLEAPNTQPYHS